MGDSQRMVEVNTAPRLFRKIRKRTHNYHKKAEHNCHDLVPPAPGLDIIGVRLSPKYLSNAMPT